ncbi:MAG: hypothetical protein FJ279_17345, partial [Planctomycetes bacterium]|nr:hypothetical protein [Planctomycetota bacterium]
MDDDIALAKSLLADASTAALKSRPFLQALVRLKGGELLLNSKPDREEAISNIFQACWPLLPGEPDPDAQVVPEDLLVIVDKALRCRRALTSEARSATTALRNDQALVNECLTSAALCMNACDTDRARRNVEEAERLCRRLKDADAATAAASMAKANTDLRDSLNVLKKALTAARSGKEEAQAKVGRLWLQDWGNVKRAKEAAAMAGENGTELLALLNFVDKISAPGASDADPDAIFRSAEKCFLWAEQAKAKGATLLYQAA